MLLILRPSCCYLPLGREDGVRKSDDPDMDVWLKMPCQIVDFVDVLKNQHDPYVCLIWGIANCKPQDRMCGVFFVLLGWVANFARWFTPEKVLVSAWNLKEPRNSTFTSSGGLFLE